MGDQRVLYVLPKENVLFPATGRIREVIIEECTKRDDYSPVIIDGSHIYRIDSSTSKVNLSYYLQNSRYSYLFKKIRRYFKIGLSVGGLKKSTLRMLQYFYSIPKEFMIQVEMMRKNRSISRTIIVLQKCCKFLLFAKYYNLGGKTTNADSLDLPVLSLKVMTLTLNEPKN